MGVRELGGCLGVLTIQSGCEAFILSINNRVVAFPLTICILLTMLQELEANHRRWVTSMLSSKISRKSKIINISFDSLFDAQIELQ